MLGGGHLSTWREGALREPLVVLAELICMLRLWTWLESGILPFGFLFVVIVVLCFVLFFF